MATKNVWDPKDPVDVADFWYNFSDFLADGVTIASETVEQSVNPLYEDIPVEIEVVETDFIADKVRCRLGGGTVAVGAYPMDCTVTCSDGQVFQQTVWLHIKERIIK